MNVNLLSSTLSKVEAQSDLFAANFYQILGDLNPEISQLIDRVPPSERQAKLMEHLKLMVDNADNERAMQFIFRDLGKKYASHQDIFDDYSLVGAALFQALKDFLVGDWTIELERAWQLLFQTATNAVIEGARSSADANNDLSFKSNAHEDDSDSLVNLVPQILSNNTPTKEQVGYSSKSRSRSIPTIVSAISIIILVGAGYFIWSQNRSPTNNNRSSPPSLDR